MGEINIRDVLLQKLSDFISILQNEGTSSSDK